MPDIRVAVIDDWQNTAAGSTDWTPLEQRAEVVFLQRSFPAGSETEAAELLGGFDIILPLRERSSLRRATLEGLPRLKMIAATGGKTPHIDLDYCTRNGIIVTTAVPATGGYAAEMTLGLMLAAARDIPRADAGMRAGRFQDGVGLGVVLRGKTLGIIGLGKIGSDMARYGNALGMRVLAWSRNLTPERAAGAGAEWATKKDLLSESDIVTLHLVLSDRSRGTLDREDLARMREGALLVNTSRGPLVDERALLEALHQGRLSAALDVYDEEPLPPEHPLRSAPNTVLSPHLGFSTREVFRGFYQVSIENILAFLDGEPARVANPDAVANAKQ